MGNELSKKQRQSYAFEIVEEGENKGDIVIENTATKEEMDGGNHDNSKHNNGVIANKIDVSKLEKDLLNHVTNESQNTDKSEEIVHVNNGGVHEENNISAEEVTPVKTSADATQHVTPKIEDTKPETQEIETSQEIKDNDSTEEVNKRHKKKKDSKKGDSKKRESLFKRLSKKSPLKQGKPAAVMVENETYEGVSYVPCMENDTKPQEDKSTQQAINEEHAIQNKNENENDKSSTDQLEDNDKPPPIPTSPLPDEDEPKNYLQEAVDLINAADISIPSSDNKTQNEDGNAITDEHETKLETSYEMESKTLVDDVIVQKTVSTVSHEAPISHVNGENIGIASEDGITENSTIIQRIVNSDTITEVVNDGDRVNITITTISSASETINETTVVSKISSTMNTNPAESESNTTVVQNGEHANAVNSKPVVDRVDSGNADNTTSCVDGGSGGINIVDSSNETACEPSANKSPRKADEKKQKKEEKKKQKEKRKSKADDSEHVENSSEKEGEVKQKDKKSDRKFLKMSLSKSSSKSDEEKKLKKKKKEKKGKDKPESPAQKDEPSSPVKGIFDEVPVEIEVHEGDTVSLSSLSGDEQKSKPKETSNTKQESSNTKQETIPDDENLIGSDEYVTLSNVKSELTANDQKEEATANSATDSSQHDEGKTDNTTELQAENIDIVQEDNNETPKSDDEKSTPKKKSKKDKKKRGSKLFSFRSGSDSPKEKDKKEIQHTEQEVSFEQDPKEESPKERRRSFSEFLRPVFGNLFSKNSPKRKSKVEVDETTSKEHETTMADDSENKNEHPTKSDEKKVNGDHEATLEVNKLQSDQEPASIQQPKNIDENETGNTLNKNLDSVENNTEQCISNDDSKSDENKDDEKNQNNTEQTSNEQLSNNDGGHCHTQGNNELNIEERIVETKTDTEESNLSPPLPEVMNDTNDHVPKDEDQEVQS